MEAKYFALSAVENNRFVRLIQVAFGVVCFAIAVFWMIFNFKSMKADQAMWITIIFLLAFGFYMVWAGLGKAIRFIEIGDDMLLIKKTILLPASGLNAKDLRRIEVYPFSIKFLLEKKKITLRLSSSYYETNASIKDEILNFADNNGIQSEIIEEKI